MFMYWDIVSRCLVFVLFIVLHVCMQFIVLYVCMQFIGLYVCMQFVVLYVCMQFIVLYVCMQFIVLYVCIYVCTHATFDFSSLCYSCMPCYLACIFSSFCGCPFIRVCGSMRLVHVCAAYVCIRLSAM